MNDFKIMLKKYKYKVKEIYNKSLLLSVYSFNTIEFFLIPRYRYLLITFSLIRSIQTFIFKSKFLYIDSFIILIKDSVFLNINIRKFDD